MIKIDMHNHTAASPDAITKPEEIIKKAKEKGIDALAITDHNTTKALKQCREIGKKENIYVIQGQEITTKDGDLIALFILEEIKPYMSFDETLDEIKSQGAIAYVPHPFDLTRHGIGNEEFIKKCHVIEVYNAKSNDHFDKKAVEFSKNFNMLKGAGSDSHAPNEVGRAYVKVEEEAINTPEKFLMALRNAEPVIEKRTGLIEKLIRKAFIKLNKEKKE